MPTNTFLLKEDIARWLVHWKADPEIVLSYLSRINSVKSTNSKNDYFAYLLVVASAARAYKVDKEEVKLALRQMIEIIYNEK